MTYFKKITGAVALTLAFGVSAFADCAPRDGIIQSPPCASAQIVGEQSETQPDVTNLTFEPELAVTEVAIDVVQTLLTIF
jgi:hypothetical protein